jgi:hypothetical protein
MGKKRFSVEQIVAVLNQAELGLPVADLPAIRVAAGPWTRHSGCRQREPDFPGPGGRGPGADREIACNRASFPGPPLVGRPVRVRSRH